MTTLDNLLDTLDYNIFSELSMIEQDVKNDEVKMDVDAARKFNCDSDACILKKKSGQQPDHMKIEGPRDVTLLNNYSIDATLKHWAALYDGFYAYNFNMRDFKKHSLSPDMVLLDVPDTLETIKFGELWNRGFRCGACIVNTDVYSGRGKHWMALFFDARPDPMKCQWTVEFFNSSGNPPTQEWIYWMEKTATEMQQVLQSGAKEPMLVRATNIRQQKSKSECGVYSLFYIYARLNNVPYCVFAKEHISDKIMFMMRQHLFSDDRFLNKYLDHLFTDPQFVADLNAELDTKIGKGDKRTPADNYLIRKLIETRPNLKKYGKFDYEKYKNIVKIIWE